MTDTRLSIGVHHALWLVQQGRTLSAAARIAGVNLRSVRRALRRQEASIAKARQPAESEQAQPPADQVDEAQASAE
jgi:hypothetical protein